MLRAIALLLALITPGFAGWGIFQDGIPVTSFPGWHTLPIGGGGNVIAQIMACDQGAGACSSGTGTITRMARTDVGGAVYWLNPSTAKCGDNANRAGPCWQNILTPANFGTVLFNSGVGARDMTISPANTQIVYLYFGQSGCMYKSTTGPNGSYTKLTGFTCTGFTNTTNNGSPDAQHSVLADPNNASVVYASAPGDATHGAFVSTDGGTTWTNTSSLFPTSGSTNAATTIYAFDTSNSTTGGKTNNVFACVNGTGVYKSVNAGGAFTELNTSGMPATCEHMEVDATGVLWLKDDINSVLYTWVPGSVGSTTGTWTAVLTDSGNLADFAIDYNHSCTLVSANCRVVAIDFSGNLDETINSGSSWTGFNSHITIAAADAPWLISAGANCTGGTTTSCFLDTDSLVFDITQSNVLTITTGAGYFVTNPPGNSTSGFTWTSNTADMEEIVANKIIAPPGFTPVMGGWDRGTWSLQSQTSYPSFYAPNSITSPITGNRTWDVAYSNDFSSTGLIVQINGDGHAYTTTNIGNGSGSNWTQLTGSSLPLEQQVSNGSPSGFYGGGIVLVPSQNNYLWFIGEGGDPYYTTNGGTSWAKLIVGSVPVGGAGVTDAATSTSSPTLSFAHSAGYIDSGFVSSVGSTATLVQDASNGSCSVGTVSSASNAGPTHDTITLTGNAACSVGSGDSLVFYPASSKSGTGWAAGALNSNGTVDRASTNVAYVANYAGTANGLYKFFKSGGNWTSVQVLSGNITGSSNAGELVSAPSTAGDLYFSNAVPSGTLPSAAALMECIDSSPSGTSAGTVSCQTVSTTNNIPGTSTPYGANVTSVLAIGAGKPKSGGSGYSAFYFYGSIDGSTMGVYQTYDHFQTFTQIAGNQFQGCGVASACSAPTSDGFGGRYDNQVNITGDLNTQGLVYLCFGGTACLFGQFN